MRRTLRPNPHLRTPAAACCVVVAPSVAVLRPVASGPFAIELWLMRGLEAGASQPREAPGEGRAPSDLWYASSAPLPGGPTQDQTLIARIVPATHLPRFVAIMAIHYRSSVEPHRCFPYVLELAF